LPIGETEKRLFDAIDGERRIVDIAKKTLSTSEQSARLDSTRDFFERLWWHDQVVFSRQQVLN
jgi:hypothetical protein